MSRWVAWATAVATTGAFAVAITTPARSGPNCLDGCIGYPYTDAAAYVPRDYLWMYPAVLVCALVVALAVGLYAEVPPRRSRPALAGVCFAAVGAGVLVVDYAIQLFVAQPALLRGETDGLSLWSQYNPHGVFIGLENIGYAILALALLLLGLARWGLGTRAARVGAGIFTFAGAATLVLLVVLGAGYGADLEYRFEVFSLVLVWFALIAGGVAFGLARTPAPTVHSGRSGAVGLVEADAGDVGR